MIASLFHDVIWIWDYQNIYFTLSHLNILTTWLRIWNKKEWGFTFVWFGLLTVKCKCLLDNHQTSISYSSLLPHSFSMALSFFVSSLCSEVHLVNEGDSSLWCIMAPALSAMFGSGAVGSEVAGAAALATGELAFVGTLTALSALLLLSVLLLLCASCQGWVSFKTWLFFDISNIL